MANEITTQLRMSDPPAALLASWRDQPPAFLADAGYRVVDEAIDTLVFEADVTGAWQRIMLFGQGRTLYRLAIRFDADGTGSRVTVTGQAPEPVRQALAELSGAG